MRQFLQQGNLVQGESNCEIVFVEDSPRADSVNGTKVVSKREFVELECSQKYFNVAIANSSARERIATELVASGCLPLSIRAPGVQVYDHASIGEGAILCANTIVTSNVDIGCFFHLNIYSYVEHDCIIGDFVTFAPGVRCNGNVHIHNHAYIGSGAMLKNGSASDPLVIGEGAVVGMGAVVTKSVPAHTTVIGNPARPLIKR